jgi:peptidoglycan/xylan/chitin deacetylase (PgdA/CDA1 family)
MKGCAVPPSVKTLSAAARWLLGGALRRIGNPSMWGARGFEYDISAVPFKIAAITFDDGPDEKTTPEGLRILAEAGAHATFFVLGEHVDLNPAIVAEIAAGGHELASHGHSHTPMNGMSADEIKNELLNSIDAIYDAAPGSRVRWFRPPYGRITRKVVSNASEIGLRTVLWTIDPQDWRKNATPGEIAGFVLARLRPGSIILLHSGMPNTPASVRIILREMTRLGYKAVTISALRSAYLLQAGEKRDRGELPLRMERRIRQIDKPTTGSNRTFPPST